MHPNRAQKKLFQKCLQHHRYFYNKTVETMNKAYEARKQEFQESKTCVHCSEAKEADSFCCKKHEKKVLPWKIDTRFISMRSKVMQSDEAVKEDPEKAWQAETPYDTRQLAIQEAVGALKSAITNKKRGNIQKFQLGYKRRNAPRQVFCVDSSAIKKVPKKPKKQKKSKKGKKSKGKKSQPVSKHLWLQMFPKRLEDNKYVRVRKRALAKLPEKFNHDCKVMKYGKHYYLLYVFEKSSEEVEPEKEDNILSLDPGVRTFQTGYSPSGLVYKFGDKHNTLLQTLHDKLDNLRSLRSKATLKQKQRLRKACLQVEHKILNLIEDLHNQTASHIARKFQTVFLPKFSTSVMQKAKTLSGTVKRDLWSFSHYKFQQKLLGLCNHHKCVLYVVEEHYTTKTCGGCGTLMNVGSAKKVSCGCGYEQDRDVNGARNILLKHLTQYGQF